MKAYVFRQAPSRENHLSSDKWERGDTKVGVGSLPMTLRCNVAAAFLTGLVVSVLIAYLTKTDFGTLKMATRGTSVGIGIILALLASLT